MRRAARALVTLDRWAGKEATSNEAAQLAILRSLDLQRLTRASARLRQYEAAALLARASIEMAIVGMWAICDDNAIKVLSKDNAYSVEKLVMPLVGSLFLPPDAIKNAVAKFDTPHRFFIGTPLNAIKEAKGSPAAQSLYEMYYGHLSAFFGHGTGLSLMRHVGWDDQLKDQASFPWSKRSPAHLTDVCLGALCLVAAGPEHPDANLFRRYAVDHDQRTALPLGAIAGVHLARDGGLSLAGVIESFREMQAVADFATGACWGEVTHESRVERVEQGLTAAFAGFGMRTAEMTTQYSRHLVHLWEERDARAAEHKQEEEDTSGVPNARGG